VPYFPFFHFLRPLCCQYRKHLRKTAAAVFEKKERFFEPPKRNAHCVRRKGVRAHIVRIFFSVLRSFWRRRAATTSFVLAVQIRFLYRFTILDLSISLRKTVGRGHAEFLRSLRVLCYFSSSLIFVCVCTSPSLAEILPLKILSLTSSKSCSA
jgi:hypothetical protein